MVHPVYMPADVAATWEWLRSQGCTCVPDLAFIQVAAEHNDVPAEFHVIATHDDVCALGRRN